MLLRRRSDWSRRLPQPLAIPEIMISCLEEAALDGDTQNVAIPLRMVLVMGGSNATRCEHIHFRALHALPASQHARCCRA